MMETGFDLGNVYVTVDIDYKIWAAEPEVRWGDSPQPGCPAQLEILDVFVTSVSGETYDLEWLDLVGRDWPEDLNRLALAHVEQDVANNGWISEHMFEMENEDD